MQKYLKFILYLISFTFHSCCIHYILLHNLIYKDHLRKKKKTTNKTKTKNLRETQFSQCRSKVVPQRLLQTKDNHEAFTLLRSPSSNKSVVEDGNKTDKPRSIKKC